MNRLYLEEMETEIEHKRLFDREHAKFQQNYVDSKTIYTTLHTVLDGIHTLCRSKIPEELCDLTRNELDYISQKIEECKRNLDNQKCEIVQIYDNGF